MKRQFRKMHGLGNDFVIFDARDVPLEMDVATARALGDRRTGIGFDQLIVMEPSDTADLRMRIWNSDGSEVEACGNATRCVALIAGGHSRIETMAGILEGQAGDGEAEIDMGVPRFGWDEIPLAYPLDTATLPIGWEGLRDPAAVNVGNPHVIFFVDDAGSVELERLGPIIENDPLFPDRINVNIASLEDGAIRLRVWERGAGLTRACGTGACATAVAAIRRKLVADRVEVRLPGGALTISWTPGATIRMRGGATHVFTGEVDL
ncbi:diaminopimelate epimerase [Allosphingosinicella deserti]|uniref:Diaminopimelate epimerase n=1 Tax=Allosphingosinicella deserti TaxID=2116704 RepID=A0A2P7QN89_9SPHN|nr:diaminopimelate epimerase [Sphingomonas deserti]PSJ39427.1 diaminopimelate epimerase [Sphingomonas deserti]